MAGFSNPDERRQYITQQAQALGLDPAKVLAVAQGEGGLNGFGQSAVPRQGSGSLNGREDSWGPLQMYAGGQGQAFQKQTGLDFRNPDNESQMLDWQLNYMKQHGNKEWYGAKATPLGNLYGQSMLAAGTGGTAGGAGSAESAGANSAGAYQGGAQDTVPAFNMPKPVNAQEQPAAQQKPLQLAKNPFSSGGNDGAAVDDDGTDGGFIYTPETDSEAQAAVRFNDADLNPNDRNARDAILAFSQKAANPNAGNTYKGYDASMVDSLANLIKTMDVGNG